MVRKAVILIFGILIVISCTKGFRDDFKKLFPLRNAVIKEFDVKDVRVAIQNGNYWSFVCKFKIQRRV